METYDLTLSDRIQKLKDKREWYNDGHLRLNSERTRILTDYYRTHEAEYPILKRAGFLYDWCAKREIHIEDEDILISSTGPGDAARRGRVLEGAGHRQHHPRLYARRYF